MILLTGATGTIGQELLSLLSEKFVKSSSILAIKTVWQNSLNPVCVALALFPPLSF